MVVFIHHSARLVRQARNIEQRLRQCVQLRLTETDRFALRRQCGMLQDFNAQIVSQTGVKRMVKQQTGELTAAEPGRQ